MGSNNPRIPYVRDGILCRYDGSVICAVANTLADKTGWYDWLEDERHKSFAFTAGAGAHCTVVKEKRVSTSGRIHYYWFAYRSINWKKKRVSLGKSHQVNLTRLAQAAAKLAQLELIPEGDSVTRRSRRRDASSAGSPKLKALTFGTPTL